MEYINDNFLIWGGDLRYAEPFRVSYMVGATTFPFFCVLTNVDGNVELLERIEGNATLSHLNAGPVRLSFLFASPFGSI